MWIALGAAIRPDNHNAWAQIFDKMPAGPRDSEKIHVIIDVAENVECCVVLKKEVHFDANSANVLEHVGKLHMLGIGAEAIESVKNLVPIRSRKW